MYTLASIEFFKEKWPKKVGQVYSHVQIFHALVQSAFCKVLFKAW